MNTVAWDTEFWFAVIHSRTFWQSSVMWAVWCIVGCIAVTIVLAKTITHRRWRRLHADETGAAGALDIAITLPIFCYIVIWIVQFGILANDSLVVHYSAYTAARSARVMWHPLFCPILNPSELPGGYPPVNSMFETLPCADRINNAARFPLIAIAPVNPNIPCNECKNAPTKAITSMLKAAGFKGDKLQYREDILFQKAQYAFDKDNAKVKISIPITALKKAILEYKASKGIPFGNKLGADFTPPPVTASVNFRVHLMLPVGRLYGIARTDGPTYYRNAHAEVSLL